MANLSTRSARRGVLGAALLSALLLGQTIVTSAADAAPVRATTSLSAHDAQKPSVAQKEAQKKAQKKKAAATAAAKAKAKYVYRPRDRTSFNYPLSPTLVDRFRIRHQIRMAIQHAPGGSAIRLATFTFDDPLIEADLIAAHRRGVSVQVLVSRQHAAESASLKRLTTGLKHTRNKSAPWSRPSFTRICFRSCRGKHGLLHAKLFMFSSTGASPSSRAHWVTMVGSANLTRFAAVGQWNHMNTVLGKHTYVKFLGYFNQLKQDTYQHHTVAFQTKKLRAWTFPHHNYTLAKDPIVRALHQVDCSYRLTGSKKVHHSSIRIGMYAWFDPRGNALAKLVRQKWEHGCRVYVIYAEANGTVLSTLRSRAGRGPIPVSRSVTLDRSGEVADYNHSKYLALAGRYDGHYSRLVWSGSMNFTALGVVSDEIVVRLHGDRVYDAYLSNFNRVWNSPSTRRAR